MEENLGKKKGRRKGFCRVGGRSDTKKRGDKGGWYGKCLRLQCGSECAGQARGSPSIPTVWQRNSVLDRTALVCTLLCSVVSEHPGKRVGLARRLGWILTLLQLKVSASQQSSQEVFSWRDMWVPHTHGGHPDAQRGPGTSSGWVTWLAQGWSWVLNSILFTLCPVNFPLHHTSQK